MNGNGINKWLVGLIMTILIMVVSLTLNVVNRVKEVQAQEYRESISAEVRLLRKDVADNKICIEGIKANIGAINANIGDIKQDLKELRRGR